MHIDVHHALTYALSRIAGFSHEEANVVATSSQYVDDAKVSGIVHFDNGARYHRISSSHKASDASNLLNDSNYSVWLPFHFLPGNGGLPAGRNPDGPFIVKLVCRTDSPASREMVLAARDDRFKPRALHRLGIAVHVYADTWAHQGFAGVLHGVNAVDEINEHGASGVFPQGLSGFLEGILMELSPQIGHGEANILPDLPFLSWSYRDSRGETVSRDNTALFLDATRSMHRELFLYRHPDGTTAPDIPASDLALIGHLFSALRETDGKTRHAAWLREIGKGAFSFGPAAVFYESEGSGSWKAAALGTSEDRDEYPYREEFLSSDWKLFHDALQAHRYAVLHDILPRYGICAG